MSIARMIRPFVRACSDRIQLKNLSVNNPMMTRRIEPTGIIVRTFAAPKKAVEAIVVLKNKAIRFPVLRVVYTDEEGKSKHEVMNRVDALKMAEGMELDLVLINDAAVPPICKIENYGKLITKKKEKAKEIRVNAKARALKEMFIGGGIDTHDLGIKMKKVIEFLADGHPVRIFVTAKKLRLKTDPFCVEETTMRVLDAVENHVQSVQQPESSTPSRKDFTLNPKVKKEEPVSKKNEKADKNDKNDNNIKNKSSGNKEVKEDQTPNVNNPPEISSAAL